MLNYGICKKCKKKLNDNNGLVECTFEIDEYGRLSNRGPDKWACPVVKDRLVAKTDKLPPVGCYYDLEHIMFFKNKKKKNSKM